MVASQSVDSSLAFIVQALVTIQGFHVLFIIASWLLLRNRRDIYISLR